MAKHGGHREGAGRRKGTPNVKTAEVLANALQDGLTPVEYMLNTMRDENADQKERQWAAEKAAPYCHPRPAPVQRTIEIDLPDISTIEGIKDAISKIAREAALGTIAPAEAQSLVAVVETQRKTIDTQEIVERIERLEAAAKR